MFVVGYDDLCIWECGVECVGFDLVGCLGDYVCN